MFLKRLVCQGFKSFADKTEFEFTAGVTGIVGPNGCGKSNVVDSIKWVLGDQSPRSLRGKQMMDVIFNGSGTRKSAGMAQVDLMFDNADRKLAYDAEEVIITRRLFRTGESEYLINNQQVRLKDIRELFMDTGVGMGAYSIIEQGRVSLLLEANPQERRAIFEEAAGISRYKARKREAERKLERVEQNLLRIEDVIEELDKRLRSIRYQAGKARNFQQYDQQLREKRAVYSLAEYHRMTERRDTLERETAAQADQGTALRTRISGNEAKISALEVELLKYETDIRQLEQQYLNNASELTANRERIEQSRQRTEELAVSRHRALQRLATVREQVSRLRHHIESEEAALKQIESDLQTAHAEVEVRSGEDRELARQFASLRAECENEKASVIELMRRSAQMNNQIQSIDQRCRQLDVDKERLNARREQIEKELRELLEHRAGIDGRAAEISSRVQQLSAELNEKKQQAIALDAARAELHAQLSAAKEHRSGLLSRKQLLVDLDQQMEGVDAGVREVLHWKEKKHAEQAFSYVRGMVADLIAADISSAVLIETALGEFDQYLVVDNSELFLKDADLLADFPGRVHAICLDRLPSFVDGHDFSGQEGFVAKAIDLVRYPAEAEALVRHLLGKTIIVRNLEDAVRLSQSNPPSYRYVTQSGQLYDPDGICQLGPAGARAGIISRKSELRLIDTHIEEVDVRIAEMNDRLDQAAADAVTLENEQESLRSTIHEFHKAEVENNAARNTNENAARRLTQEQPLIESELKSLDHQNGEAQHRREQTVQALADLEQQNTTRESHIGELIEQMEQLSGQRAVIAERITEAKVKVGELGQKRSMIADRFRGLRETLRSSEDEVQKSTHEAEESLHRMTQAERTILTAQCRLAELYAAKEVLDRQLRERQHAREQMRAETEELSGSLKVDRQALAEIDEQLHQVEMELQAVRIHIDELVSRVREELAIELVEVYQSYQHQEQDWPALEAEIEQLKEKIRRLGNVNLDAISEQDELEKRSEFLSTQRDDLRSSKTQLVELIDQLNNECRERFSQTFEAVRGHFQELYRKLFGGGKADVMLEQPAEGQPLDVLEAGIEIVARPPGKEPQSITLLSGGEKTMTAIALVLAIFRSRPSPFAILDEVDAALDEANNERFNRIVGEFLEHSQFLIITHSKRTMSIADVLYGVTMQEAGVSKRVSVKFDSTSKETAAA